MRLTHLSLSNYRNFTRLDQEIPAGAIILLGSNAQGKTSLLESVFYLAAFESFHASNERQLVNFIAARDPLVVTRIVADFQYTGQQHSRKTAHHLEVRLILEANGSNGSPRIRKEILLDGVKKKTGEALGHFNAVLFLPQMLQIIEGSPDDRRHYINLTLSQIIPVYAASLQEYNQVLTQRNALLKNLSERPGDIKNAIEQLGYWDDRLSDYGAQIIYFRIQSLKDLERLAVHQHNDLTRGQEILRLDYRPAYDPYPKKVGQFTLKLDAPVDRSFISLVEIRNGFREALEKLRTEEISRGVTTVGPHRDDIRILGNGVDLGIYGSRGQARTAVLSLKLAEVTWMREKTGQWPVLLLDEVLAELDPLRRSDLLEHLASSEQVLLTTTDLDLFSVDFVTGSCLWNVQSGRVTESAKKPDLPSP